MITDAYVGALGPMGLYGPIATLWNGGAYQLKFPADQLKLHGCVHFTKETCVCGFKMSKKWSFVPIQNDAIPIVAAGRPRMNGWVYLEIVKGMYGLKQAVIIANMELTKHLEKFCYHPVWHTPGLWKHNTRATIFTLVFDDFAIKYASKQDADHLLQALCNKYTISTDWDAFLYIGITLDWNYTTRHVDLSLPKYFARALHKFKQALQKFHPDNKPEYSPQKHVEPNYGKKVQYAEPTDDAPPLDSVNINLIQKM